MNSDVWAACQAFHIKSAVSEMLLEEGLVGGGDGGLGEAFLLQQTETRRFICSQFTMVGQKMRVPKAGAEPRPTVG